MRTPINREGFKPTIQSGPYSSGFVRFRPDRFAEFAAQERSYIKKYRMAARSFWILNNAERPWHETFVITGGLDSEPNEVHPVRPNGR